MKAALARIAAIGLSPLACAACGQGGGLERPGTPDLAKQEALRLGVTSPSEGVVEMILPESFGPNDWGPADQACTLGGYDLRSCAGRPITLTRFPMSGQREGCSRNLLVITIQEGLCCAYESGGADCVVWPGVHPVGS